MNTALTRRLLIRVFVSDDARRKQEITEESNDKDSKFVDEDGTCGGGSKEVS